MTITQLLQRPGEFTVRLTAEGISQLGNVNLLDHLVITPTRIQDPAAFSDANVLSVAIYSGVITGKPDERTIIGEDLGWWLGTGQGLGDLIDTAISGTAQTLAQWVTLLLPASITVGTITNTGTSYTGSYQWMTRREALTHVCRQVGAEWRINPNGTFDAAAPATLWGSTAKAMITRKPEGPEGSLRGVEAVDITAGQNIDGYTTKVIVVGKNGDVTTSIPAAVGSATGAAVYKDFNNNNAVLERLVDAPQEPNASVTATAQKVLDQYSSVRRKIDVTTRTWNIPLDVRPGHCVYVYDLVSGTYDMANQQTWRGETLPPVLLRCRGYTYPIITGGVYLRRSGATATYIDLTPWIEWETDGEVQWEIGASDYDADQDPNQQAAAFLGPNPGIVTRTQLPPVQSFATTVTSLTGVITTVGAVTFSYTIDGGYLDFWVSIAITTNGTGATGIQFTLPIAPASPAQTHLGCGRENVVTGAGLSMWQSGVGATVVTYANGYPAGNGYVLKLVGRYRI